jgi:predicted nucleotidyltransferase
VAPRDAFLERVAEAVSRDARILAVAEGGSAAAGEVDEFSDVDVLLVCTDEGHGPLLLEARDFAAGLGPLLTSHTAEHVGRPETLICLYGPPLLHVDLDFVTASDLAHRVESCFVVWEREPGSVATAPTASAALPPPDPQWIEDRFWSWVHYLAAKIGRGELFDCIDGLAYLRAVVFGPMLAVRQGRRPQGVRRLELYAGDALPELEQTAAEYNRESCIAGLHAAIGLYRRLREERASPGLVPRVEAEAASVDYLAAIEQRVPGGSGKAEGRRR